MSTHEDVVGEDLVLVVTRQLTPNLRLVPMKVYDPKRAPDHVERDNMKRFLENHADEDIRRFKEDFVEFKTAEFHKDWVSSN